MLARKGERPFDDVFFRAQHRLCLPILLLEHFVDDLDLIQRVLIARGDLAKPLFIQPPHGICVGFRQPIGNPLVIEKAVQLRRDAVLAAIVHAQVGCGTAGDLFAVCGIARVSFLRLDAVPIKRDGGKIEIAVKKSAIGGVFRVGRKLVEHEDVRAVFEIVRLLPHLNGHARKGLAVSVGESQAEIPLAVFLDVRTDALLVQRFLFEKGGKTLLAHFCICHEQHSFCPCGRVSQGGLRVGRIAVSRQIVFL